MSGNDQHDPVLRNGAAEASGGHRAWRKHGLPLK